jgi:hypothetical protein
MSRNIVVLIIGMLSSQGRDRATLTFLREHGRVPAAQRVREAIEDPQSDLAETLNVALAEEQRTFADWYTHQTRDDDDQDYLSEAEGSWGDGVLLCGFALLFRVRVRTNLACDTPRPP